MSEFVQLARQPIIDSSNAIIGYELFHRDKNGKAVDFSLKRRTLSAQVILSVYNLIGRERTVDDKPAFYNIDPDFLNTDIIEALPPEQCIFELNSTMQFSLSIIAKIKSLHAMGYVFALDNFIISPASSILMKDVLPYITYLKVDVQSNDPEAVQEHLGLFLDKHIAIAHKIESTTEFSTYKEMGFKYFQGYYIKQPEPVKHYRLEPKQVGVTRLFKMIQGLPFSEFAVEFERYNELAVQFFQYLISTNGRRYDASQSVHDLVNDFGKEMMKKWLMLIVYAKGGNQLDQAKNTFSTFLAQRIDLMNTIVSNVHSADPQKRRDELKLLAIFSTLLDVYQVPYIRLTELFTVSKNLELWLNSKKGRFSLIYKAVNLMQHHPVDIEKVDRVLKSFKTDYSEVMAKLEYEETCDSITPLNPS